MKRLFLTLEGGEGAGKSTLLNHLSTRLQEKGYDLLLTREPGGTPFCDAIRNMLLSSSSKIAPLTELALYLASRAEHVQEVLLPALAKGKIVLCDRFHDSSVAYQGGARGLGLEEVMRFSLFVSQNLKPDLTFYLDIDPVIALKRINRPLDRLESEKLDFHKKVRNAYLSIAKKEPKRFYVLDATKPALEVFEKAWDLLLCHLKP